MSERYEKRGATVRLESSARGRSVITLREGGFAQLSGGELLSGPLEPARELVPPFTSVNGALAEAITRTARSLAVVERLSIVEGRARHRFISGSTRRQWEDTNARLFVSLVRQPCGRRAAISLGARSLAEIDTSPVSSVCQALALSESLGPLYAPSVTLEPWVAASLVRVLATERVALGRGLRLAQQPPDGAKDGTGRVIRKRIVRQSPDLWVDCFRPSFRFAPVHTPLHVALLGAGDEGGRLDYVAVALASNWFVQGATFLARAWIVDRVAGSISFGRIAVDPTAMSHSTVVAEGVAAWFPEGAGAWGCRLTLKGAAARVQSA